VRDGWVDFGYQGQRTQEIARDIAVEHVAWFYLYAKRLNEPVLREALMACGATDEEARTFARALVERIRQLGPVRLASLAHGKPSDSLAHGRPPASDSGQPAPASVVAEPRIQAG
jgi:hypothetical protein